MLTLGRALTRAGSSGEPLPVVFRSLERAGIRIRKGQVTMIAGLPNSGKSMIGLWLALRMEVPTLYFSADTDSFTMAIRAAAMETGHAMENVEAGVRGGGEAYYEDVLSGHEDIRFVFESSPTLDDIDLEVAAFEEIYGSYPAALFVDNLLNVAHDNGDEWSSIRELSKVFHHIARQTGSAVVLLHHASEAEGKPEYPPARKSIQGKISQMPEVILTLARSDDEFRIACVKNRSGPADPSAKQFVTLACDMSTGRFADSRYDLAGGYR